MTDNEIYNYLKTRNWSINANDAISDIFNTSPQIIHKIYDFDNQIMKIITPNNEFSFNWVLKYYEGGLRCE